MSKNKFVMLGICAVALSGLLAVYLTINESEEVNMPVETKSAHYLLERATRDDIEYFFVEDSDLRTLRFSPDEQTGIWGIEIIYSYSSDRFPPRLKVDQFKMDSLIHGIIEPNEVEWLMEVEDDVELSGFGLDPAIAAVTVNYRNRRETTLLLGRVTPDGLNRYIMREGDNTVYTIDRSSGDIFTLTPDEIADKSMPGIDTGNLRYVYIASGDTEIELVPEDPNGFGAMKMTKPYPRRDVYLYSFALDVLGDLSEIVFDTFVVSRPGAGRGLGTTTLEVKIRDEENEFHLLVGDAVLDGKYYAKRGGDDMLFTIDGGLVSRFHQADPFSFMDRFIAMVNVESVKCILIAEGEDVSEILPNETDEFRTWYQALMGLSYDSALPEFEPSGEPLFAVEYHLTGGALISYEFYDYNDNFYAADYAGNWLAVSKQSVNTVQRLLKEILS